MAMYQAKQDGRARYAFYEAHLDAALAERMELERELAEAIRDPEVRKVLRDEKTRKELAALLRLAAQTPGDKPQAA